MMKLKSLAAGLILAVLSLAPCFAQGVGQLGTGQLWANTTASQSRGSAVGASAYFDFVYGSTRGSILERGASGWHIITPGTSGLAFVSNGAGADGAYQVLGSNGLPTPGASTLGGVNSKDCSSGGQFVQKINTDGSISCVTPAGGGNVSNSGSPTNGQIAQWINSTQLQGVALTSLARSLQQANATYFVRTVPVAVTITNASPAVVTHTSHGYSAGQLVTFNSTTSLPNGLTAGTIYCVIAAGLATNTYEVSATCGGSAINTSSAGSGTFTEQAGNDLTGTGSAQTATAAFMTLQGAINYLGQNIDAGNFGVTIQAACSGGGGVALYGSTQFDVPLVGGNQATNTPNVDVKGDTTTPSNCLLQDLAAVGFAFSAQENTSVKIEGFKVSSTTNGGYGLLADTGANLWWGNMEFGAMTGTGNPAHINAHTTGARAICLGNYTISGSAGIHWYAERGGYIECPGVTITLSGTPAFGGAFAFADNSGLIYANGDTFSGSATGTRYFAQNMGNIQTLSGSTTYFPGNAAGTPSAIHTFTASGASCCGLYN